MDLLNQTVYGPTIYTCVKCLSANVIVIIAQYARYPQPLSQEQHNTLYLCTGVLDVEEYPLRYASIRCNPVTKRWHVSRFSIGEIKMDPRWAREERRHRVLEFTKDKALCPDKLWRAVVLEKQQQKAEAFKKRIAEFKAKKQSPLPRLHYGQAVLDAVPCLPTDLVVIVARYAEHTLPLNLDIELQLAISKLKPECYQDIVLKWREFFGVPPNTPPVKEQPPRRIARTKILRSWCLDVHILGNSVGCPNWAFFDLENANHKSGLLHKSKTWLRVVQERNWLKRGKLPDHLLLTFHEKQ